MCKNICNLITRLCFNSFPFHLLMFFIFIFLYLSNHYSNVKDIYRIDIKLINQKYLLKKKKLLTVAKVQLIQFEKISILLFKKNQPDNSSVKTKLAKLNNEKIDKIVYKSQCV